MATKKLMTYARVVLVVILLVYLLFVWMYFKDNVSQLTSTNLLLWFVMVPLIFLSAIFVIRWRQKKLDKQPIESTAIDTEESIASPDAHQLFIYSNIGLPEGGRWTDIIENHEDLTALSEELIDFDGLPVLIKPIDRIITQSASAYYYDSDLPAHNDNTDEFLDLDHTDQNLVDIDTLTLRLAALISEQFSLSDEALSALTQHYELIAHQGHIETNVALHAHPEWQTHYIASTHDENQTVPVDASSTLISELSIYLCVPSRANADYLVKSVNQQLASYGIPEALLNVHVINADDNSFVSFIDDELIAISATAEPKACLLIAADSLINEAWLEEHLSQAQLLNHIPSEASTLFVFYNQAADAVFSIDGAASVSMLKIDDKPGHIDTTDNALASNRSTQYYARHLGKIKGLLLDNAFKIANQDESQIQNDSKVKNQATQSIDNAAANTEILSTQSLTVLSDINPSKQPYDLALFMTFVDDFIEKGALVNDHHLGHYMPLNLWLQPLISLSMLTQLAVEDQHESDIKFLITQHKRCCTLWLIEDIKAS